MTQHRHAGEKLVEYNKLKTALVVVMIKEFLKS